MIKIDMRLKSLRKERPAFEIEGVVINGNRMDLSQNNSKPTKFRSNNSFAFPASLNIRSSNQNHEMITRFHQSPVTPAASQSSNRPSYQAIETAYLEHGVRIRVSPTRTSQQSERKSVNSLQRHTAFISRNPIRTTSVLHYTTTDLDQHHDSRSFSALQQSSSNDFEQTQTHNVSYAQSSQLNEEIHDDYLSPSIIVSEHSNPITPPEKLAITNNRTTTTPTTLYDNDPDLLYMSSLLKKPSGDSFLDTIRRRAGLRATFSIHRRPLTSNSIQPQQQQQIREKSPNMNRNSLIRLTTSAVIPSPSLNKIDKDIVRHASRIRRISQSKDYLLKSSGIDTTFRINSPSRINNNKRNSINKPLKSLSLEPLEFLLSPPSNSASLSTHELPSIKTSSKSRHRKTSKKRPESAKISIMDNSNITNFLSTEHSNLSSVLRDESLSLMRTSPLDITQQSNSFDSGCYDRSSSSGDLQSLTSSSIVQIPSSRPSAHRPNTNKKVSFYEEPSAMMLTTATYV